MEKLNKNFFGNEVLVWGCTPQDQLYYKRLQKGFTDNGVTVYPMSITPKTEIKSGIDFKTYDSLEELPRVPACVYVLADKEDTNKVLKRFSELGVKRIAFYSMACVSKEDLEKCASLGMEARIGCPMMLYGRGPCTIHAFFTGVKRK